MEDDTKDVNTENSSDSDTSKEAEEASTVEEDVQSAEESTQEQVDKLLKDGTSRKKTVPLDYERFEELNEKSKLFEQFSPILQKLKDSPDVLDQLTRGEQRNDESLEERIRRIEEREKSIQRNQIKGAVTQMVEAYGKEFTSRYDEIRPIAESLQKSGISVEESYQRAYLAINPSALEEHNRIVQQSQAKEIEKKRGVFDSSTGQVKRITKNVEEDRYPLNDADRDFAQKAGIDPKLYSKHADWLKGLEDL
jgi:hypothetical protein